MERKQRSCPRKAMRGVATIVAWALAVILAATTVEAGPQSVWTPPREVLDTIHFRSIGPTKQGGRIMDIAVPDPAKQPHTYYAAASTGGLWRSMDKGLTWTPIFDDAPINAIGDVAVSWSDPEVLYVGTGNFSYWGEGVFRSSDGGSSWRRAGLEKSLYISRIRVHPSDPDTVWVAAVGSWYDDHPEKGVFKSDDGGASWQPSLTPSHDGYPVGAADIVLDPRDPDTLYASTWDRHSGAGSGIYKSRDGGGSWTRLGGGLPNGPMDRIGLDVHQSDPDIVVATILLENPDWDGADSYSRFVNSVWRSDDAGTSWRRLDPGHEQFDLRGASRFGQIRIDPMDPDRIFVLNTGIQGTPDGGRTWKKMIRFGGDHQGMWIDPTDPLHMVIAYDYGLAISFSGGETWYHPDNLPLGQLEAVGVDMARPYNVYGGMQDFGTWRGPSTKRGRFPIRLEDWEHVKGADGGYAQVDPTENRWLYVSSQRGSISRNDQRTGVRHDIQYRGEDIRFNFIAPFQLSPHDPNVLYHGANVLLRSPWRGEGWEVISPDVAAAGADFDENGRDANGTISTLAESPLVQGRLWVGTDNGNVWTSPDAGESWRRVDGNITDWPGYKVTRVEPSHHDADTAYVTASAGHRDARDLRPWVYRTIDGGETWESIAEGLPADEPVNVIREDPRNPDLLFLGTAKGIQVSLDRGRSWTSLRNNMPNVPIHDLAIHPRDNDLVVGTYGRSFWIADIAPLQELAPSVLARDIHLFDLAPRVLWISARQTQVASALQNYEGENAPHGVMVRYWLRAPAQDVRVEIWDATRKINEYAGPTEPGLHSVQWYLTERIPRTAEEIADWEEWDREVRIEEEYFDYYDGTDHFGSADEEVSVFGRSLEIWIHPLPEWRERDWKHIRAQPGLYRVDLVVDGERLSRSVRILPDDWFDKTY